MGTEARGNGRLGHGGRFDEALSWSSEAGRVIGVIRKKIIAPEFQGYTFMPRGRIRST
jgi:hypothetical protein